MKINMNDKVIKQKLDPELSRIRVAIRQIALVKKIYKDNILSNDNIGLLMAVELTKISKISNDIKKYIDPNDEYGREIREAKVKEVTNND